jgi:hypothetical protein
MSTQSLEHDPPPTTQQRRRAVWLGLAIAAPPAAWTAQLLLLTAISNYTCFPSDIPLRIPAHPWVHAIALTVDCLAVIIALLSAAVAWQYLRDHTAPTDAFGRLRQGRLHFVAMGGVLSGTGFLAAILFETIATLMVPPCAG